MQIFKTFFYDLWSKMPIWLLVLSCWFIAPLSISVDSPQIAIIGSVGIIFVLFFTSIVFSVLKKINFFTNTTNQKLKYLAIAIRIALFIITAALFTTIFEFVCKAFFYGLFLHFESFFQLLSSPCLVLSQYGAYPINNNLKRTLVYCVETAIGFSVFLIAIGISTQFLTKFLPDLNLSKLIGLTGLIIILGFSKFRANKLLNSDRATAACSQTVK